MKWIEFVSTILDLLMCSNYFNYRHRSKMYWKYLNEKDIKKYIAIIKDILVKTNRNIFWILET